MFYLKNKKKLKKVKTTKKFDLKNVVWLGFNYTCGMAFPLVFSKLIIGNTGTGIGLYIYLVLLLGSAMAAIMGYAYSKMSKIYIKSNGGTYVYVRGSFGRFLGWLIGALQYLVLPIATSSIILSMISINLHKFVAPYWGTYTDLYLNFIGVAVYLFFASIIFFGLKYFKFFLNISGIIKWASTIFIVFCAISLSALDHFQGFLYISEHQEKLTFNNFNNAFVDFFYFYGGFETYSTITKNVKNPSRTMSKSIMIVTALTLIFYTICTIFFMGANPIAGNPNGWFGQNPPLDIAQAVSDVLGIVFVISSMITLKLNAAMQSSLYASAMLEPLALEQYVTPKLSILNQDKISVSSSSFNIALTISTTLLLTCLPIIFSSGGNVSYANILGFTTAIMLMQYILVLCSIANLYIRKKMLLKIWEVYLFILTFIFLTFELIMFFYDQFDAVIKAFTNNSDDKIDGYFSLIELLLFAFFISVITLIYYAYYMPIYRRRQRDNPGLQEKLNQAFELSAYAKLEKDSFHEMKNNLNELKAKYTSDLKAIDRNHNKEQYKQYLDEKNKYIAEFKSKLTNLKKEYVKNYKTIDNKRYSWSEIKNLHSKYIKDKEELLLDRDNQLSWMKINNWKKYLIKKTYWTQRREIKLERVSVLEEYINHEVN